MRNLISLTILVLAICGILRICGIRTSVNVLPCLLTGEKVLFLKKWVWLGSAKSLPTYRWWPSVPPLVEDGLYVTDRRVLHVFHIFRLIKQEFSQWFEGKAEPGEDESLEDVSVRKSPLLGPYLDVLSQSPVKRWYRSHQLRLRLFMRDPESVRRIISEAMAKST